MSIVSGDILVKGSGGATPGNGTANAGPGTNLGGFATSGTITDNTVDNLFPDVTGTENAGSNVDYQCFFVHNNTAGGLTYQNGSVFVSSEVAGGASVQIGLDPTATSALTSASAQAVTTANKNTAPAGVAFSYPTTRATGLNIGNIAPAQVRGVWIKRTAANTTALSNDGVTLEIDGDSL